VAQNYNLSTLYNSGGWNGGLSGSNHARDASTAPFVSGYDPLDPSSGPSQIGNIIGYRFGNAIPAYDPDHPYLIDGISVTVDNNALLVNATIVAVGTLTPASLTNNKLIFDVSGATTVKGSAFAAGVLVDNHPELLQISGNILEIKSTVMIGGNAGGGASKYGKLIGNGIDATLNTSAINITAGHLFGAMSDEGGTLTSNFIKIGEDVTVNVSGGIAGANTRGHSSAEGSTVSSNYVDVRGPYTVQLEAHDYILGAYIAGQADDGDDFAHDIQGNYVYLERGTVTNSGSTNSGIVAGAWGHKGNGSTVPFGVQNATFSSNYVTIAGPVTVNGGGIFGAAVNDDTDYRVSNTFISNYVKFEIPDATTGTVTATNVYGARGFSGTATSNEVWIYPTQATTIHLTGNLAGVTMEGKAQATGNIANVSGGSTVINVTIDHNVFGANVNSLDEAGNEGSTAKNNQAILNGGVAIKESVYGARVVSGDAGGTGLTDGNKVNIGSANGTTFFGTIDGSVYGAHVSATGGNYSATNNSVTVTRVEHLKHSVNNTWATIYGGYVNVGGTSSGNADGNSVTVDESEVGEVYGGYVANASATGHANSNNILFSKATLAGDVFGGFINGGSGVANNNTVVFRGLTKFAVTSTDIDVSGGGGTGSGNKYTGNKLYFDQVSFEATNNKFGKIGNFSELNITINSDLVPTTTVIRTQDLDLKDPADLTRNSSVKIIAIEGSKLLDLGTTRTLVDVDNPITVNVPIVDATLEAAQGVTKIWGIKISQNVNALEYTPEYLRFNDQAKSFAELPLADLSFVNRGSDNIAEDAIPSAAAAVMGANGFSAFASLAYGKSRTATGSHIEVKGLSGNVGLAIGAETSAGIATAGLFLEFGRGEFDSFNDFAQVPTVQGNGDVTYLGGGILGRFEVGTREKSRPYVEASARLGRTKSDFNTNDILGAGGANTKLELHSRYYGFHAGAGYILNLLSFNQDGDIDFSAKYFHTRRDGDEFFIGGEKAVISDVSSSRLRVGARVNIGLSDTIKPYVGGYFEREFNGDSRMSISNIDLPEVSLEGNTGIGELGLTFVSPSMPLEFQIGAEGTGGKRDGISGNMKISYTF
jgi:hypothetical protein